MQKYIPAVRELNDNKSTFAVALDRCQHANISVPRGASYFEIYSTQDIFVSKESITGLPLLNNVPFLPEPYNLQFVFKTPVTGTTPTGLDPSGTYTLMYAGHVVSVSGSSLTTIADVYAALAAIDTNTTWVYKNASGSIRVSTDTDIAYIEGWYTNNPTQNMSQYMGSLWDNLSLFDHVVIGAFSQVVVDCQIGEFLPAKTKMIYLINPTQEVIGVTSTDRVSDLALVSGNFYSGCHQNGV